jgi:glycosyltransferase
MKTVFLMIARILYDKGYQEYVEATRIIRKEHPGAEFRLLGRIDEEYPNHVPAEVVQRDHVEGTIYYLGFQSNVRQYIREADCIVHPTFYNEGMSRVLMEAMALRKPIITTSIPGCRETVEAGKNGFLIPPKDTAALVYAIRRFLSLTPEERQRMGGYGRAKAEREFDVRQVIEVYKRITRGKNLFS